MFLVCIDSGHGGQIKDLDGDEDDGFDESTLIFSSPFQYCALSSFRAI